MILSEDLVCHYMGGSIQVEYRDGSVLIAEILRVKYEDGHIVMEAGRAHRLQVEQLFLLEGFEMTTVTGSSSLETPQIIRLPVAGWEVLAMIVEDGTLFLLAPEGDLASAFFYPPHATNLLYLLEEASATS